MHLNFNTIFMRPSCLGGGRIMRHTLSVRLSVRPSRYRTEGRISYGHLGRTDSCCTRKGVHLYSVTSPGKMIFAVFEL